jgi:hypothetical protein
MLELRETTCPTSIEGSWLQLDFPPPWPPGVRYPQVDGAEVGLQARSLHQDGRG